MNASEDMRAPLIFDVASFSNPETVADSAWSRSQTFLIFNQDLLPKKHGVVWSANWPESVARQQADAQAWQEEVGGLVSIAVDGRQQDNPRWTVATLVDGERNVFRLQLSSRRFEGWHMRIDGQGRVVERSPIDLDGLHAVLITIGNRLESPEFYEHASYLRQKREAAERRMNELFVRDISSGYLDPALGARVCLLAEMQRVLDSDPKPGDASSSSRFGLGCEPHEVDKHYPQRFRDALHAQKIRAQRARIRRELGKVSEIGFTPLEQIT